MLPPSQSDTGAGTPAGPARTKKARETRARIVDAALELLLEQGYEKATMRAIAERAGVAPSNAYYYFASKEELVQAFYARTHEEHLEQALPAIGQERTFKARLLAAMRTKLATIEPYHEFAGVLFKTAADPKSPLNPFSEASRPVRDEARGVFEEVVSGSRMKLPADLQKKLPELLWLWHMGIVLFWIYDDSPDRQRTQRLVERTTDLIVKLVSLSSLKLLSPLRRSALRLLSELQAEATP